MKSWVSRVLCGAFLMTAVINAQAITLDWNSVDWTDPVETSPGSGVYTRTLDQYFDIDGSNAGDDIRIQITNSGTWVASGTTGNQPPNDTTDITGGLGGQQSLMLVMDNSNDTQGITVTITFLYANGVQGVAYSLFDVDAATSGGNNFIDEIRNFYVNGANTTNVTISGSTDNTVTGSGTTGAYVTGNSIANDATSDANADISYGSAQNIYSVSFFWGNDTSALSGNPSRQAIGLGDITYTASVPEPSTYASGILLFALAGYHFLKKRRNNVSHFA